MYIILVLLIFLLFQTKNKNSTPSIDTKKLKSLVINLDHRDDRLRYLNYTYQNSDMSKIPLERLPAVDGMNLDLDTVPISARARMEVDMTSGENGYRTQHYQLTQGAVGCYLSHLRAYKELLNDEYEYYLILEDDADIPPNLLAHILDFSSRVPKNWDILLLGHLCKRTSVLKKDYRKVKRFFLLHCYVINKRGAEKLLKSNILPMTRQIDWYIGDLSVAGKINIYATPEPVCKQTGQDTNIQVKIDKNKR